MKISDPILTRMSRYLDFSSKKQQVITSNLANVETPGYRAKEVRFEEYLADANKAESGPLKTTHAGHLPGKPQLVRQEVNARQSGDSLGYDQNNVDLDKEMVDLAENVMKFSVMGRLLQQKLLMIKSGIREGRQ